MSPTIAPRARISVTLDRPPIRDYSSRESEFIVCYKPGPVTTLHIHGESEFVQRLYDAMRPELATIVAEIEAETRP